ncbi:hypothetical protein AMJ50_02875 [Parcubacteria bacterium DG_74_3]|nr:MAG: hypothetical protein AMJ50_02875 [Parcubacteria bacterium DG_74_3]
MYGKLLKYILFLLLISIPFKEISAQQPSSLGLSVNPQIFELDVWPEETINKKIKLKNLSEVPVPIEVRLTDFTAEEDSGEMIFDESLQDISVASRKWFEVENPNLILETGERREINFTISVPENAEIGGHYVTMLFEPVLPSFYFQEGQLRHIPVIGVLFLISVKTLTLESETEQKLEVVEFDIPKEERLVGLEDFLSKAVGSIAQAAEFTISKTSPSKFLLKLKNNDIYHIRPSGKVLIYNIFGKKVGEAEVSQRTILPGRTRQFPVEFSLQTPEIFKWLPASIANFLVQNFFIGKYRANLELQAAGPLGSFGPTILTALTFFSLPWQFWLVFLIILGTMTIFMIKYRQRIKLSLRVLLGR